MVIKKPCLSGVTVRLKLFQTCQIHSRVADTRLWSIPAVIRQPTLWPREASHFRELEQRDTRHSFTKLHNEFTKG